MIARADLEAEASDGESPAARHVAWPLWASIAAAGVVAVIWLQAPAPSEPAPVPSGSAAWPESELHEIVYREFSPAGTLAHELRAASGQLFGADAGTAAVATLREATVTRWGSDNQTTHLSAPTLTVWPDSERLETDGPVSLRGPSGEFSAVGATMSLKDQRIELKSAVRGRHALPERGGRRQAE